MSSSVDHWGIPLSIVLFHFHSGPVLSDVMGLISELKSELNNRQLLYHKTLTCIQRNETNIFFHSVSLKYQNTKLFFVRECSSPQSLQFTAWILQYIIKCIHSWVFKYIPTEVQFSQVWWVWFQSWSQGDTLLLFNTAFTQSEDKNRKTMFQILDGVL